MNFCGGAAQEADVPVKPIKFTQFACCSNNEEDEPDEVMTSVLSPSASEEEDENNEEDDGDSTCREQTKVALDIIQKAIEGDPSPVVTQEQPVIGLVTPQRKETTTSYNNKNSSSQQRLTPTSHSPSLLNPIQTELWEEETKVEQDTKTKPNLLCPTLEPTNTMEGLVQRLQGGFRVNLHENSTVEPVFLFLNQNRTHLCIARCDEDEKKDNDNLECWLELLIGKILRLEFGKTESHPGFHNTHPMTCFSIVVNQDSSICYYDFEAKSTIEREVIVSTLMVVLEQQQVNSPPLEMKQRGTYHVAAEPVHDDIGTKDAPILCSPSLEQAPIPCSPSLEQEMLQKSHLSPRKRTQIHNDNHEGTEASLVIHLEDAESNDLIEAETHGDSNGHGSSGGPQHNILSRTTLSNEEHPEDEVDEVTDLSLIAVKPKRTMKTFSNKLPQQVDKHEEVTDVSIVPFEPERSGLSRNTFSNDEAEADMPRREAAYVITVSNRPQRKELIRKMLSQEESEADKPGKATDMAVVTTLSIQPQPGGLALKSSKEDPACDKPNEAEPDEDRHDASNAAVKPQPTGLTVKTMSEEDLVIDKPDELTLNVAPSGAQLAGAWCTDDICTLALRDIADTCTGIFEMKQKAEASCLETVSIEQMVMIEEYITAALGAPSAMYTYLTEPEVWNSEVAATPKSDPKDPELNNRVRNRASLLNAQAVRLRSLQKEMTFATALKQSKERMHCIKTTQSFDDNRLSRNNPKLQAASDAADQFHASALLQSLVEGMIYDPKDIASVVKKKDDEEAAFYDSDPEDVRPRRSRQDPRRMSAEIQNQIDEKFANNRSSPSQRLALSGAGFDRVKTNKKVSKRMDEDAVVEIVQAMSNERLALIWHPTQTKKIPNRSPVCVKMWVESGVYLNDGTILLPKLTWVKASDDETKPVQLHKVDLLDICRIRATEKVDRRRHPFAIAGRSFVVETQSHVYLMEARTKGERDRIVYALKLVVARLASLLMLRDIRAADEFFGTVAPMVPGEAPIWGKGSS